MNCTWRCLRTLHLHDQHLVNVCTLSASTKKADTTPLSKSTHDSQYCEYPTVLEQAFEMNTHTKDTKPDDETQDLLGPLHPSLSHLTIWRRETTLHTVPLVDSGSFLLLGPRLSGCCTLNVVIDIHM